jgi:hypothetical protein
MLILRDLLLQVNHNQVSNNLITAIKRDTVITVIITKL